MAKKKAIPKKKLMPEREVVVKSRAYGVHTRAARGSKTPVAINDVLKENAVKTAVVNSVAKRVHDLLKQCGKAFKEAMLWQVMLSRMRKGASGDALLLLKTLEGMELNSKYPLKRFINPASIRVENNASHLTVYFNYNMKPHIRSTDQEYCTELFLLLLGNKEDKDILISASTGWMDKEEKGGEMLFTYDVPPDITYYLLCQHFMTGNNGRATETLASRGMHIIRTGEL